MQCAHESFSEVLPGPRPETDVKPYAKKLIQGVFKKKKNRKQKDKGKRNNGWLLAMETVRRCVLTAHGLFISRRPWEAQDTSRPSQHQL